ncbi:MAG: hypothetical protein GY830_03520 [Bacteroidetes bacterium]|nr:hypothetical protein [Bacteroidota bacterium]
MRLTVKIIIPPSSDGRYFNIEGLGNEELKTINPIKDNFILSGNVNENMFFFKYENKYYAL